MNNKTTIANQVRCNPLVPLPDPSRYRQVLPAGIRRAYEWGEIGRAEVWGRLERLWGSQRVARLIASHEDGAA